MTLRDNAAAFTELGLAPGIAGPPASHGLATTVMGQSIALPVVLAPTGALAVHPDGELAAARAAAARGTAVALSSFAGEPVEDIVAANRQTFFQMYWIGSRDRLLRRLDRARAAGVCGLVLTADWSFAHGRDWGSPDIPERLDLRSLIRLAPGALSRPKWLLNYVSRRQAPKLTMPNLGDPAPTFRDAYREWRATPPPTWEDIAWLRDHWDGPFLLKGVMRIDDAKRAVQAGVSAISVSNHGGNNVDCTPASVRALPAIAEAVGDQVEVLLDGGIRRGSDVVKALALGARAVMIGRAYLWGLAVNGQAGVENVLDILSAGMAATLCGLRCPSVRALAPDDIVIPHGFVRRLGAAEAPAG